MKAKIESAVQYLRNKEIDNIPLGIILGTGLEGLAAEIELIQKIAYADIPHFPVPKQEFHQGFLLYGLLEGKPILAFQGRVHRYEGYNYFEITFWVRVFKALGGEKLIFSNVAGAINLNFNKGELMLLSDHINLQDGSPLAIKNIESLGPRFVDMSEPYSKKWRAQAIAIAEKQGLVLHQGVYAAVVGPQLETAAEYRFLKIIGADAVGMSTAPEVIVARQLEIEVIAFSVLTDLCDPAHLEPINIPDILAMAKKGEVDLIKIVKQLIKNNLE